MGPGAPVDSVTNGVNGRQAAQLGQNGWIADVASMRN